MLELCIGTRLSLTTVQMLDTHRLIPHGTFQRQPVCGVVAVGCPTGALSIIHMALTVFAHVLS